MRSRATILILFCVSSLVGCCPTSHFGGEGRLVELRTNPEGREVFVIPNEVWIAEDDKSKLLNDSNRMEDYRKGVSPVQLHLMPVVHVFVAKNAAQTDPPFRWLSFTPGIDNTPTIDFEATKP